nr:hypothetical protein [Tanacetum cinerariifolium]
MNQNFYEPNMCYNSISFDFDQFQPPQFPVIHQPPQEISIQEMEDLKHQRYLDEMKSLINSEYRDEIKIDELNGNFNRMSIEINKKEKLQQLDDDESSHEEVIHEMSFKTYSNPLFNLDEEIISRINEANCDPEEDIHLVERLLYDNLSPRPPKDFNSKNYDVIIESFSPSPIPVEDIDPFMEEIDLFLASDGS